jgi:putative hemolysin
MEIIVIFVLTLLNGFFALSEIALVSVKKSRIEHLAAQGNSRAKTILLLLENPENFLSSVQVGITLIGIISGAYGGAALTDNLEQYLVNFEAIRPYVHNISLFAVIGSITYFSIVIGELVPKSIAMNNAEVIALNTAPIIKYFTLATYPFVRLLSVSTNVLLKLFGIKENESEKVSEEELRFMLKNAGKQGVLENDESQVHQNLFSFTDQTAKSLMTHKRDVEWIDYSKTNEEIFHGLQNSAHSKFVVADKSLEHLKGVIHIKAFFENFSKPGFKLDSIIEEPIFFSESISAFKILNLFKAKKQYIGLVIDEFGAMKGIITLHDLFEAIVGDLPDIDETDEQYIVKRTDGSYLIDGRTMIYELNQFFQREVIEDNIDMYTTISGFVLSKLNHFPVVGEKITHENIVVEIMDMDGTRIDKVLLTELT